MANRPIDWLVIQRSDGPNEFTTVQSLYAVNNRDEVLAKMQRIVNGIQNPTRPPTPGTPDAAREQARARDIPPILDRLREIIGLAGRLFADPNPSQHVLRHEGEGVDAEGLDVILVTRNRPGWAWDGYSSGFPEGEMTYPNIRRNFYWALTDLVGLFLTKLGPAPAGANPKNFYLPLIAVYARWVARLMARSFQVPTKYQITWVKPAKEGGYDEFSLGASLGSLRTGRGSARSFKEDLQRARWELTGKDPAIRSVEYTAFVKDAQGVPVPTPQPWRFESYGPNGMWKFGNCAETYPLILQHLVETRQDQKNRTHGFAFNSSAVRGDLIYNETNMLQATDDGAGRQHIAGPCDNCKWMIRHYWGNEEQFAPLTVFPFS